MASPDMRRKENRDKRQERVPLGTLRSKMTIPTGLIDEKNYQGRWVVDRPGRLEAAEQGGYAFVKDASMTIPVGEGTDGRDAMSTSICRTVGTHEGGKVMKAYLMKIRRDWYEADQKKKQVEVNKTDQAIQEGQIARQPGDKRYIGSQGIKYTP